MTLEEKINQLRAAEKRLRKHLSEDEFGVVRRTAEGFGREADLLEELQRYKNWCCPARMENMKKD